MKLTFVSINDMVGLKQGIEERAFDLFYQFYIQRVLATYYQRSSRKQYQK